jgi:hypothetical protein
MANTHRFTPNNSPRRPRYNSVPTSNDRVDAFAGQRADHVPRSTSKARACLRSDVSKPSLNQA